MDAPEDASTALLAKILAMAFLGVSSFVAGSAPVCVFERLGIMRRARGAANAVLRLILNFGGGVLLCTTFLHLLPEVREGVERLAAERVLNEEAPLTGLLAELIMCAGFFFMYSVEELVHGFAGGDCHAHDQQQHPQDDDQHQPSDQIQRQKRHHDDGGQPNMGFDAKDDAAAVVAAGKVANYNSCTSVDKAGGGKDGDAISVGGASLESVLKGFLVVGALSIHELFEGLAVGLEKNATLVRVSFVFHTFYSHVRSLWDFETIFKMYSVQTFLIINNFNILYFIDNKDKFRGGWQTP